MGGRQSKEEQLYHAVQAGHQTTVKALRRDGASLEWVDKEGRTPLILACTRGELFDMVITLLHLGANITAYRAGTHGGTPLHHAAKRGLDKTVILLLERGANPLQSNDDGLMPLDLARTRGYISIVRIIEDRLSIFSGVLRELSGPGFLEALVPQWVTRKVWVVVLPARSQPKKHSRHELVIYQSLKVSQPKAVIQLARARIRQPDLTAANPVVVIVDRINRQTYKFLAEHESDNVQLHRLFEVCTLSSQIVQPPEGSENLVRPALQSLDLPELQRHSQSSDRHFVDTLEGDEQELHHSENVSLTSAVDTCSCLTKEAVVPSLNSQASGLTELGIDNNKKDCKHRDSTEPKKLKWIEALEPAEAGPSRLGKQSEPSKDTLPLHAECSEIRPSTANEGFATSGNFSTAPLMTSGHVPCLPSTHKSSSKLTTTKHIDLALEVDIKVSGQCVVCWDAPVQGVCIPCGHLAGCMDCLLDIKERSWGCPVCRTHIEQAVKVYAV